MIRDDLFARILPACSIAGVGPLPVLACPVEGGHDGVAHMATGRTGADCEPTGQQPYRGTITLAMFSGLRGFEGVEMWPGRYYDLLVALEENPIGELVHPTKGRLTAWFQAWSEKTDPDAREGVHLEVQWTEHNATAGKILGPEDGANPTSTANVEAQADTADAAVSAAASALGVTGTQATKPVVTQQIAGLEAVEKPTPQQVEASTRAMLKPVEANLALPGFQTAAAHDAVIALEILRASVYGIRGRYLGNVTTAASYTVGADLALWEIALDAYGDASKTALILGANRISDPTRIRAGTVLVIPPA